MLDKFIKRLLFCTDLEFAEIVSVLATMFWGLFLFLPFQAYPPSIVKFFDSLGFVTEGEWGVFFFIVGIIYLISILWGKCKFQRRLALLLASMWFVSFVFTMWLEFATGGFVFRFTLFLIFAWTHIRLGITNCDKK
jgi:hypothetical protein